MTQQRMAWLVTSLLILSVLSALVFFPWTLGGDLWLFVVGITAVFLISLIGVGTYKLVSKLFDFHLLYWMTERTGTEEVKRIFDLLRSGHISDEVQLFAYLVKCTEISPVFVSLGLSPEEIASELTNQDFIDRRGSRLSVLLILRAASLYRIARNSSRSEPRNCRDVLVAFVYCCIPEVRAALEKSGVDFYKLIFRLAHDMDEADLLLTGSPVSTEAEVVIEILNDSYTPMEFVVQALMYHFGMEKKIAEKTMLQIHMNGSALCRPSERHEAAQVTAAINAEARKRYFPLFCRVVSASQSGPATALLR